MPSRRFLHQNAKKRFHNNSRKRLAEIFCCMANLLHFLAGQERKVVWSLPSDLWPGGGKSTPWACPLNSDDPTLDHIPGFSFGGIGVSL